MRSKTHIFMENLLIENLNKGKFTLPGIGDFTPSSEI